MKTMYLLLAALLGALALASFAHAQDTSSQQNAQAASTSNSNAEYGGVSGSTSATGSTTRTGWPQDATCGHLPRCGPDAGH
ncbi:hypothetical protein CA603_17285 [Paraburkholderia hospita]|nr:hypothetical protein CA603_17285 [Paraburkholderia hospita]